MFNLGKTLIILVLVNALHAAGVLDAIWDAPMTSGSIANANTIFNLICALAMLPLIGIFERLSYKIIKAPRTIASKYDAKVKALNPLLFETPSLALNSCYRVLLTMLKAAIANVNRAFEMVNNYNDETMKVINDEEQGIDMLTDTVSSYMTSLSPQIKEEHQMRILLEYNKLVTNFERLGDQAEDIANMEKKMYEQKISFSSSALDEINVMHDLLNELFENALLAFRKRDVDAARNIEPLEEVMDDLTNAIHDNHLERLHKGNCNVTAGIYYLDLLSGIERLSDICSNIGVAVIARVKPEIGALAHSYISSLHQGSDKEFDKQYNAAHERYFSMLSNESIVS